MKAKSTIGNHVEHDSFCLLLSSYKSTSSAKLPKRLPREKCEGWREVAVEGVGVVMVVVVITGGGGGGGGGHVVASGLPLRRTSIDHPTAYGVVYPRPIHIARGFFTKSRTCEVLASTLDSHDDPGEEL